MTIGQHTIAVVDDDTGLLRALGRLLKEAGYCVESFASGGQALSALPASQAICLVIDCQLGDMSGVDLAKQLSAAGNQASVIFMTGSEDDLIRRKATTFGCLAYLKKPFLGNELLASIATLTIKEQKSPAKAAG